VATLGEKFSLSKASQSEWDGYLNGLSDIPINAVKDISHFTRITPAEADSAPYYNS
jgi:hypothetical protein